MAAAEALAARAMASVGDANALKELLTELLPRIRNLVRYLVRGDRDVDDIAQEVLVVVIKALPSFRGEGTFFHWLDRIVSRTTLAEARRRRVERWHVALLDAEVEPPQSPLAMQDEVVVRRWAVKVLDELPAEQRASIVLHDLLGWRVAEVASELDVPHETVRSRLRLARKRLRAHGLALGEALSEEEEHELAG